jgi:hypothetical protein
MNTHLYLGIKNYLLIGLIIIFGGLRFFHLDAGLLWQDEAEYSVLAKNVALYGLPTNKYNPVPYFNNQLFDSYVNPNSLDKYQDINYLKDNLNTYYTWFPFYLMATSYKVFGISTSSARAVSALFGILSALLLFLFMSESLGRQGGLLGCFLYLSTYFNIYIHRLAVHYSIAIFFELSTIYLHYKLNKTNDRKYYYLLVLNLFLFFHSQMVFFTMASLLIICYDLFQKKFKQILRIFLPVGAMVALWIWWSKFYLYFNLVPLNSKLTIGNTLSNYLTLFENQIILGVIFCFLCLYALGLALVSGKNQFYRYIAFWFVGMLVIVPLLAPWWLTPERCSSILLPLTILVVIGFAEGRRRLNGRMGLVLFLLIIAAPFAYLNKLGRSSSKETIMAIYNNNLEYGANWIRDFLDFNKDHKISSSDLVLSSMDNVSLAFYTNLNPRLAWTIDYEILKSQFEKYWYIETPDKKSCSESAYLLADQGEQICSANSYLNLNKKNCKKYPRSQYDIYECPTR